MFSTFYFDKLSLKVIYFLSNNQSVNELIASTIKANLIFKNWIQVQTSLITVYFDLVCWYIESRFSSRLNAKQKCSSAIICCQKWMKNNEQ